MKRRPDAARVGSTKDTAEAPSDIERAIAESQSNRTESSVIGPVVPRLLDLSGAATYLGGLSIWTLRSLIASGDVPTVRPPALRRRDERLRRILIDRVDLDALIERWKEHQP